MNTDEELDRKLAIYFQRVNAELDKLKWEPTMSKNAAPDVRVRDLSKSLPQTARATKIEDCVLCNGTGWYRKLKEQK